MPSMNVLDATGTTQTVQTLPPVGNTTAANSLPVTIAAVLPATLTANTAVDMRLYTDVEFQFTTGTVSVTRSLDGTNYVSWPIYDNTGVSSSSVSVAGIYSTDGGAWLKFSVDVTVAGRA